MNKFTLGLAVLPFLAGPALAGQPLTDKQMDTVTAGFTFTGVFESNFSTLLLDINQPTTNCGGLCYIGASAGFITVQSAIGDVTSRLPT